MDFPEQRRPTWWRWPLVPFAGSVAGTVAVLAFLLLQWLGTKMMGGRYSTDGWYFIYIMPIITSAIFGYSFVIATHYVAPRGKFISSTVMTTILGLLLALNIVLAWGPAHESVGQSVQMTIGCVAILISTISTLVNLAQTEGVST